MYREKRQVSGIPVWFVKIQAEDEDGPLTYLGYYYSGKCGNVQILAYASRAHFAVYERDFMRLLNGFSVVP